MPSDLESQNPRREQQLRDAGRLLGKMITAIAIPGFLGTAVFLVTSSPGSRSWSSVSLSLFFLASSLRAIYSLLRPHQRKLRSAAVLAAVTAVVFAASSLASIGAAFYEAFFPWALFVPSGAVMAALSLLLARAHPGRKHARQGDQLTALRAAADRGSVGPHESRAMRELELRQATRENANFLYELHKAALREYVERTWGWDESFQRAYFDRHFDPSVRKLICWAGTPVGCIAYRVQADAIELDYVALLPDYQRRGIGTFLVGQVIAEADRLGLPVRLRVLRVNPARSLYERLGFVLSGGDAQRQYMERNPRGA